MAVEWHAVCHPGAVNAIVNPVDRWVPVVVAFCRTQVRGERVCSIGEQPVPEAAAGVGPQREKSSMDS